MAGDNITFETLDDSSGNQLIIHSEAGGDTGGGGFVESVTDSNDGVAVDNADPDNPVLALDIDGLTTTGTITPANDKVAIWDDSAGANRGALISDLISAATGVAMSFVAETTVVGSGATSMAISGLDLGTDECYFVQFETVNGIATNPSVSLFFNGDTTAANYDTLSHGAVGGSDGATRSDNAIINGTFSAGDAYSGYLIIRNGVSGAPRTYFNSIRRGGANLGTQVGGHTWVTIANVTQIELTASAADAFDTGSTMRIFRIRST